MRINLQEVMTKPGLILLFYFIVWTLPPTSASTPLIDMCKPVQADVIFLLDSSGSMKDVGFQQELEFLVHFTDLMTTNHVTMGQHGLQVGVISFSSDATIELYLNSYTDANSLKAAIRKIKYAGGGTNTLEAFQRIPEMLTADRGGGRTFNGIDVQNLVFLLTDMAYHSEATLKEADSIEDTYNTIISAIGIGIDGGMGLDGLEAIASDPRLVFSAQNASSLNTLLNSIVILCENINPGQWTGCGAAFDRYRANSFLSPTLKECCLEGPCEQLSSTGPCAEWDFQQFLIKTLDYTCPPGQVPRVYSCDELKFSKTCTNICEENRFPVCQHGGTCISHGTSYSCTCPSAWEGSHCEKDIDECALRNDSCNRSQTQRCNNTAGSYTCLCKPGFTGVHCESDIDECAPPVCWMSQTDNCTNTPGSYSCTCKPGYTGKHCTTDIDECASSPCQNGASCSDLVNQYKCHCVGRFYGINCDTHECHPTPADVVFVLDSSVSMTEEQFQKQLRFVAIFIDHVIVGPDDFQVSVVTFSFEANIEFYLDEYKDNVTLKEAVSNIAYRPGATFTNKALLKVDEVFSSGRGTTRRPNGTIADRFVFLLTDGMSTDWQETRNQVALLKKKHKGYGLRLAVIGIGMEVSHLELLNIASDPSLVYSVQDFDSLYTVLKSLVHYTCEECTSSTVSDVALFVDVTTREQYNNNQVLSHLISLIEPMSGSDISITSYDSNVTERVGFLQDSNSTCSVNVGQSGVKGCKGRFDRVNMAIARMMYSDVIAETEVNMTALMNYIESTAFMTAREDSKKIAIIFSNGNFNVVTPEIGAIKITLLNKNITVVCIASGSNVNFEGLASLVTDAFDIYLAEDSRQFKNLDVLKSYLSYSVCDLQGE